MFVEVRERMKTRMQKGAEGLQAHNVVICFRNFVDRLRSAVVEILDPGGRGVFDNILFLVAV